MRVLKVICDNCSIETKEDEAINWIVIEAVKSWVRIKQKGIKWYGERLDFCCIECMVAFSQRVLTKKD